MGAPSGFAFDVVNFENIMRNEMLVASSVHLEVSSVMIDPKAKTAAATALHVNRFGDGQEFKLEHAWLVSF